MPIYLKPVYNTIHLAKNKGFSLNYINLRGYGNGHVNLTADKTIQSKVNLLIMLIFLWRLASLLCWQWWVL